MARIITALSVLLVLFSPVCAAFAQDQQLGARTKAMGGSYTAFEDDPVSVWLNPAGIATQPDQFSLAYQTYTAYPVERRRGPNDTILTSVESESILADPAIIPSYLGAVFQLGDEENPMAIGFCYARPYLLNYALDRVEDPFQSTFVPEDNVQQSLIRFRVAFAYDFRFTEQEDVHSKWFSHLAVGGGLDIGFERWDFTSQELSDETDSSTGFGFGLGVLLGVYDNKESVRVNVGLAYQSMVEYDFNIDPDVLPAFDMPQQANFGVTVYLLEGLPLRFTIDLQWIEWSATAEDPVFANHDGFEDAVNFSVGMEYRVRLSDTMSLYPRLGFRMFDAPWGDENDLPMTGTYKLVLETDGEVSNILTFGVGLSWITEEGSVRTVDIAADAGGDSVNAAIGFGLEF